jgi:hypothetical protein
MYFIFFVKRELETHVVAHIVEGNLGNAKIIISSHIKIDILKR